MAVLLVVLYHAGVPGVGGGYVGVDVFFVVSGFLITGHLLRDVERHGRVRFADFYARRVKRLLPAALLVLVVSAVAARLFGPVLQIRDTLIDAASAVTYLTNYALASRGLDYHVASWEPPVFQHYWSLAVEEQFYLLWPLLLAGVLLLPARRSRSLAVVLAILVAGSLTVSAVLTARNAAYAYFALEARAWELAIGALVALAVPWLAGVPARWRHAGSWLGVVLIGATAHLYSSETPFPGIAALLPVLATALVLAGGVRADDRVPGLLVARPMRLLGDVSYSFYLWHWPFLLLVPPAFGRPSLQWYNDLVVLLGALAAAVLTYRLVEQPARHLRWSPRCWLVAAATASAGVLAVLGLVWASIPPVAGPGPEATRPALLGRDDTPVRDAVAVAEGLEVVPGNLTPRLERPVRLPLVPRPAGTSCFLEVRQSVQEPCVLGSPSSDRRVLLFGDSHAWQWRSALDTFGQEYGWRVDAWAKSSCGAMDLDVPHASLQRTYLECSAWRADVLDRVAADPPDVVVVAQDEAGAPHIPAADWVTATVRTLAAFQRSGATVVYLEDTPAGTTDVPSCVARSLTSVSRCALPGEPAPPVQERWALLEPALEEAGVSVVETRQWFCTASSCPAVVADMLVYRDSSHITGEYAEFLAPLLGSTLDVPLARRAP